MTANQSWWKRFLGVPESTVPVTVGLVMSRGSFKMVSSKDEARRMRLVTVPFSFMNDYCDTREKYLRMQDHLASLPFKYRKRKLKIVSLPPNPEPEYAAASEGKA